MKSNYKLPRILALTILSFYPLSLFAEPEQIMGSFNSDFSGITFDGNSSGLLKDFNIDQGRLERVLGAMHSYQSERGEALGIEITNDFYKPFSLKARPDLGPREFAISPGIFAELEETYGLSNDTGVLELENDITRNFGGKGVHTTEVEKLWGKMDDVLQTIDPAPNSASPIKIATIESNLCPESNGHCSDGSVTYDVPLLTHSIESNSASAAVLSECKSSRTAFRDLYRKSGPGIATTSPIWRAAAEFDTNCLATVAQQDPKLESFAVIKMASETDPYCGAFRIGPRQFATAMHCFLKGGKIDKSKANHSSIYLFGSPASPIAFSISPSSIENFNRFYRNGVNKIPAFRDLVVLESAVVDQRTDNDFTDIVSEAVIGKRAILPGYFVYHSERRSKPNYWPAGIRSTKVMGNDYCRIYDAAVVGSGAGCLIHRCQAIKGYSGSPLLQETADGKLALVGIHVTGAQNTGKHCPAEFKVDKVSGGTGDDPLTLHANIATLVSTELLINSGWKPGEYNDIQ
jgi:hypothetical protein